MIYLYQIGRFESEFLKPLRFKIDTEIYETLLSSFAFRKHFQKAHKPLKCILIYPVSLIFNSGTLKNLINTEYAEFAKKVEALFKDEILREDYFKAPEKLFSLHPHSQYADSFFVVHSFGEYEGIPFEASFEEIILEIFLDMCMRSYDWLPERIYVDISSGHNIYVSALIEASRLFLTFYQLQNFLPEEKSLRIYLTFSDPILRPLDRIFTLHIGTELKIKRFFSYPQPPEQLNFQFPYPSLIKDLANSDTALKRELKEKIEPLLVWGYFFYSALKNNTPLVLYTWRYHEPEEIDEAIKYLIRLAKSKLSQNYQKTPHLNFDAFRKAFLMLAIYKGIVKVLKHYGITAKKEVSISELNEKFRDDEKTIYKYFGLMPNRAYLGHELSNNFEKGGEKGIRDKLTSEYRLLREFIPGESEQLNRRNFFAHCGFERNCILAKRENGEIWIKYSEEKLEEIKKYLLK